MKKFVLFVPGVIIILLLSAGLTSGKDTLPARKLCLECHADMFKKDVLHPIAEDNCEICHTSTGEKHPGKAPGFNLSSPYPDLCYMCHDVKNNLTHVHSAVAGGDCSMCHSPHSTGKKSLILDSYGGNLCLDCHTIDTENPKSVHGAVKESDCQLCHDPHQSNFSSMLVKEQKEICLGCHNKDIKKESRVIRSIAADMVQGNKIHEAITMGECTTCHFPHSGDFPYLLNAGYPEGQYAISTVETFELCFQCHDTGIITEPTTNSATGFRNGEQNLHYFHIKGSKGRNCNLCHSPHGAPYDHLLKETVMYGRWAMKMDYQPSANGGSCATGCHKKLEYSRIIK